MEPAPPAASMTVVEDLPENVQRAAGGLCVELSVFLDGVLAVLYTAPRLPRASQSASSSADNGGKSGGKPEARQRQGEQRPVAHMGSAGVSAQFGMRQHTFVIYLYNRLSFFLIINIHNFGL